MPATVTTKEMFPKATTTKAQVEAESELRIKAGAIRSSIQDDGTNWVLITEWNVIGQND
jgi:hypothetical protein